MTCFLSKLSCGTRQDAYSSIERTSENSELTIHPNLFKSLGQVYRGACFTITLALYPNCKLTATRSIRLALRDSSWPWQWFALLPILSLRRRHRPSGPQKLRYCARSGISVVKDRHESSSARVWDYLLANAQVQPSESNGVNLTHWHASEHSVIKDCFSNGYISMLIVIRRKEGLIKLLGRHSFRSVSWRTSFQLEHNGADIQL